MKVADRAVQIWPVLVLAARNNQILTYDILGELIGVPRRGLGQLLEPIQSYCLLHKLPPLSALVVSSQTGMPSAGFIAAQDVPAAQMQIFSFNWSRHPCPMAEKFAKAVAQLPSNGLPQAAGR
jgi:hypothetical protein